MNIKLRLWQAEALEALRSSVARVDLINATPGGGKSLLAGVSARDLHLDRDPRARLGFVVPSDHLRTQIARSLSRLGVEIDTRIPPRPGFRGFVTTYAALARKSNQAIVANYCRAWNVLAYCDEIHHAAGNASWATGLAAALDPAKRIICLTGTAFTSEGARIAFLPVREDAEGECSYVATYTYEFERAVRERVTRAVRFHPADGIARYLDRGTERVQRLSECTPTKAPGILGMLLKDEPFVASLLKAADDKLIERRRRHPDAAGLVVAVDTDHALWVAGLLETITGDKPDVIVSDDDAATSSIKAFESDPRKRWVITIKMISEGVDVQKLGVLAYLSNVRTRLFWRQVVGRVQREQSGSDMPADVYMPAAPGLVAHAREMERMILDAGVADDGEAEEASEPLGGGRMQSSKVLLGSTVEWQPSIVKGAAPSLPFEAAPEIPLAEKLDELRAQVSELTNRLARRRRVEPRMVHSEFKRRQNPRSQSDMSESELLRKKQWLERCLGLNQGDGHASAA
jgi:superfamily II DNA or RNA helicase